MWRLWSKLLELLGGFSLPLPHTRRRLQVGSPAAVDAMGSHAWRRFATPEPLFAVWGPLPGSPWEPYHCVPLFASLERIAPEGVGPPPEEEPIAEPPTHARPGALPPPWAAADTWVVADLPGPLLVPAAVWLVIAGYQPVCTFDNWPHPNGVLRPERILAQLLYWAPMVEGYRQQLAAGAPPLWLCDRERLGERVGRPGDFDNRYFLDDSLLPGVSVLRQAGIQRVVYLTAASGDLTLSDLSPYFTRLEQAGISAHHALLADPALELHPLPAARRIPLDESSFRRSAAGGFGTTVPQPSEGGGSSG
jgi:hypothetical protein